MAEAITNSDQVGTWNNLVTTIVKKTFHATVPYQPDLGQHQHIDKHILVWKIALIWALKEETGVKGRLQLPFSSKVVQLLKPRGQHLYHIYILCKECHAAQPFLGYELPYKHAFEWLNLIYQELVYEGVTCVLTPKDSPSDDRKSLLRNGEVKRRNLREKNDTCTMVKNYVNPFVKNPGLRNLSTLLDAAIQLAQKHQSFKNRYFTPYISSWRDMLKSEDSPDFQMHWVENGELHCRGRSGRNTRNLTQETRPRIPLRSKASRNYQQLF